MSEIKVDTVYDVLGQLGPSTNRAIVNYLDDAAEFTVHAVSKALEALVKHGCARELNRQGNKIVYEATDLTPDQYRDQVRAGTISEGGEEV